MISLFPQSFDVNAIERHLMQTFEKPLDHFGIIFVLFVAEFGQPTRLVKQPFVIRTSLLKLKMASRVMLD